MKTVLVGIYTRYTTTLLNEDRLEKRPWEGADRMSEVQFETAVGCEEGERVKERAHTPLFEPHAQQTEEPVPRLPTEGPRVDSQTWGLDTANPPLGTSYQSPRS